MCRRANSTRGNNAPDRHGLSHKRVHSLLQRDTNDGTVVFTGNKVEVHADRPIIVECIAQQVEHSTASWSVGVLTELKTERLWWIVRQFRNYFDIDEVGRRPEAGADVVCTQEAEPTALLYQ